MRFSILCRRHSYMLFEHTGKIALIFKAAGVGNIHKIVLGLQQQNLAFLHANPVYIADERFSCCFLEKAAEIAGAEEDLGGNTFQTDFFGVIFLDVFFKTLPFSPLRMCFFMQSCCNKLKLNKSTL